MKIKVVIAAFLLTCLVGVGFVSAEQPDKVFLPVIKISPNVLILRAPIQCVTVHSNIPYKLVDSSTLELSGIAPYLSTTDARGNLVVKVDGEAVKDIVDPGPFKLTLTGELTDGSPFAASDTILVKE